MKKIYFGTMLFAMGVLTSALTMTQVKSQNRVPANGNALSNEEISQYLKDHPEVLEVFSKHFDRDKLEATYTLESFQENGRSGNHPLLKRFKEAKRLQELAKFHGDAVFSKARDLVLDKNPSAAALDIESEIYVTQMEIKSAAETEIPRLQEKIAIRKVALAILKILK